MRITRGASSFITKAGVSHIPHIGRISFYYDSERISHSVYRDRRVLEWCVPILYPPYKARSQLGQNSGGARSWPVLAICFPCWTKYNSYGDEV
jgi:hypothetical protein